MTIRKINEWIFQPQLIWKSHCDKRPAHVGVNSPTAGRSGPKGPHLRHFLCQIAIPNLTHWQNRGGAGLLTFHILAADRRSLHSDQWSARWCWRCCCLSPPAFSRATPPILSLSSPGASADHSPSWFPGPSCRACPLWPAPWSTQLLWLLSCPLCLPLLLLSHAASPNSALRWAGSELAPACPRPSPQQAL